MPSFSLSRLNVGRALLLLLALSTACTRDDGERVYSVRGVVRAPYSEGTITIHHEEISGFMPSMLMPFYVSEDDVRGLQPGDQVQFDFHVGESSRATNFRVLGREDAAAVNAPPAAGSVRRLREGDAVPDFKLVDQNNRSLSEADLAGAFTVVTFIFTRCPVPEFCPLISRHFQTLQEATGQVPELAATRLLSISIDPEYDRPEILRAYGESLGADFNRWRFATGTNEQVTQLNRLFAVHTEENAGTLDHTLATALISPDGTVVEIWRGNGWKPEQVIARLSAEFAE